MQMKQIRLLGYIMQISALNLALLITVPAFGFANTPDNIYALYFPSHCLTERKMDEFVHYAKLARINAAVLHVKDPHGRIRWKSNNLQAAEIGAVASNGLVESALRQMS